MRKNNANMRIVEHRELVRTADDGFRALRKTLRSRYHEGLDIRPV
jgi:hypothetical protein